MKLGVQCQEKGAGVYQYNRLQPNSIKAINIVDVEFWQRIHAENPRLKYAIYRECPNGQMPWSGNPSDIASGWVDLMERKVGHLIKAGLLTHYEGYNEWIFSDQPYWFSAADQFMAALIEKTHTRFGGKVHVIIGNFACGHFSEDIVKFPQTLAALNTCGQCLLGTHEYDRGDMNRTSGNWLCGKWKRQDAAIKKAGYPNVGIAATEMGLDHLVQNPSGPQVGWRHYGATIEAAVAHLLNKNNLAWYVPLAEADPVVKLLSWFGCSMYWDGGNWGDAGFDLANRDGSFPAGLLEGIKNLEGEEPPPPEPNGGEQVVIRVFNIDGVELFGDAALDLIRFHGITVHEPQNMRQGEWYWAVVKMEEREGPACFIYTGLKEDGKPAVGQEAAWAWTDDMGSADDILGNSYPTDWQKQADLGFLNENGNMGPAFGQSGWYHDPYKPGPGRAWIRDPLRWSVLLTGIGMLGMTAHRTMYATWQVKQWQGNGGEPPMNGTLEEILRLGKETREDVKVIRAMLESGTPLPPPAVDAPYKGEYFNNINLFGSPVFVRDDANINFTWGSGSPDPRLAADNFSVRWTGERTFEDGNYIFRTHTDDGVRLWVDGKLIIDKWIDQSPTTWPSTMIPLTAGKHSIRMEYYEKGGGAVAGMGWQKQ